MEHQRSETDRGPTPNESARVEDDFLRPITPTRNVHIQRRLSASLPFAIVAILVVATVAFGATVVSPLVSLPKASATPVVVGDDDPIETPAPSVSTDPTSEPTSEPTEEPTEEPTSEPTAGADLKLTAKLETRKVALSWTGYEGDDFAYYKVVRSSNKAASWPLGDGDTLVAAISNQDTHTYTDCPPAGKTWSYRVFAVKSSNDDSYIVLDATNLVTVTVPAVPKPTAVDNPADLGALHVVKNSNGTYTFSWSAYDGDIDISYYKLDGEPFPAAPGYVENGGHYWYCGGDTSVTLKVEPGTWNINVEAIYYPDGDAAAAAKTDTIKLVVAAQPIASLGLKVTVGEDGFAHLTWDKYTGDHFEQYLIARTQTGTPGQGSVIQEIDDVGQTSWVDKSVEPGHKYFYRVMAWTSETFCNGGTILAQSPVVSVRIPAEATPAPTEAPTEAPSTTPTPET